MFAVTVLGTSTTGYVRATGLAPRDSAATVDLVARPERRLLSPNDDGLHDALVVAARFSERVTATLTVQERGGQGRAVADRSTGDIVRFAWPLADALGRRGEGRRVHVDAQGEGRLGQRRRLRPRRRSRSTRPRPTSKATQRSTAGLDGWKRLPRRRLDDRHGRALGRPRDQPTASNGGATKTYGGAVTIAANGRTTIDYRATDKAGNREPWRHLDATGSTPGAPDDRAWR